MEAEPQLDDEVYCTACRTPYRKAPDVTARRCPACGHTAWIAVAFAHGREPAEHEVEGSQACKFPSASAS